MDIGLRCMSRKGQNWARSSMQLPEYATTFKIVKAELHKSRIFHCLLTWTVFFSAYLAGDFFYSPIEMIKQNTLLERKG